MYLKKIMLHKYIAQMLRLQQQSMLGLYTECHGDQDNEWRWQITIRGRLEAL
jgi:hypothetical protein